MMGFKMRTFLAAITSAVLVSGAANAAPITIDFENLSAGDVVTGQFPGVTLTTTGGSGQGIIFDTENPTGGDADLGAPLTRIGPDEGSIAGGNVLIISEDGNLNNPDDNGSGGVFSFDFDGVVTFLGFDGVDFTDAGANLIVTLFDDAGGTLFTYDFAAESMASVGDNEYYSFFTNVFGAGIAGVALATIELTGSGAIDNLTFDAAIPVPAALPLLLSGIAGLGFAMRRKRAAAE